MRAPVQPELLSEREFTSQLRDATRLMGWLRYHTWTSRHSPAGFPDEVLVRPPRTIFAELKAEKGKLRPEQMRWLDELAECGHEVYVWRPSMLTEIIEHLRPRFSMGGTGPGLWERTGTRWER